MRTGMHSLLQTFSRLAPVAHIAICNAQTPAECQGWDYYMCLQQPQAYLVIMDSWHADWSHGALQVMHKTGADFTNTFRWLSSVEMPPPSPQSNGAHADNKASASGSAEADASKGESTSGAPLAHASPTQICCGGDPAKIAQGRQPIRALLGG